VGPGADGVAGARDETRARALNGAAQYHRWQPWRRESKTTG
jgi:hypothetical protein